MLSRIFSFFLATSAFIYNTLRLNVLFSGLAATIFMSWSRLFFGTCRLTFVAALSQEILFQWFKGVESWNKMAAEKILSWKGFFWFVLSIMTFYLTEEGTQNLSPVLFRKSSSIYRWHLLWMRFIGIYWLSFSLKVSILRAYLSCWENNLWRDSWSCTSCLLKNSWIQLLLNRSLLSSS